MAVCEIFVAANRNQRFALVSASIILISFFVKFLHLFYTLSFYNNTLISQVVVLETRNFLENVHE